MRTPANLTPITSQEFTAMGSRMRAVLDGDAQRARRLLRLVPRWFAEWEARLSRFRPESELSQLNRSAGRPVAVSRTLWRVLQAALRGAAESEGLVIPTVLPALEAAGYDRTFAEIGQHPGASGSSARLAVIALDGMTIDPVHRIICLAAGTRLDFGGVAKGWAADTALGRLRRRGPALVDAGGDLAINGAPRGMPGWPVGIADPFTPDRPLALLCLSGGGVATSGRDYRRWMQDGQPRHHLIDPRTGRSAVTDVLTATVIAPNARAAEAAAKTVLIRGSREGLAWLEHRPSLAGLIVTEAGTVETSTRFDRLLWR